MSAAREWDSHSEEQTRDVGRRLAERLRGSEFVALSGPLGAGKTQFVKGLAAGLGVPPDEPVVSPTFVLVREYAGRLKLYHIDAYRLRDAAELAALGVEEMRQAADAVVVVEWADRVAEGVPADALWIEFEHVGPGERRIRLGAQQAPA
jgi:tRNA threonylcarbamoyladenosine biosynthesis protein TsaE